MVTTESLNPYDCLIHVILYLNTDEYLMGLPLFKYSSLFSKEYLKITKLMRLDIEKTIDFIASGRLVIKRDTLLTAILN